MVTRSRFVALFLMIGTSAGASHTHAVKRTGKKVEITAVDVKAHVKKVAVDDTGGAIDLDGTPVTFAIKPDGKVDVNGVICKTPDEIADVIFKIDDDLDGDELDALASAIETEGSITPPERAKAVVQTIRRISERAKVRGAVKKDEKRRGHK